MEPQLISRKAIKKILKKKYFSDDNSFNKSFNSIIETVKINWLPIVIILVAFYNIRFHNLLLTYNLQIFLYYSFVIYLIHLLLI